MTEDSGDSQNEETVGHRAEDAGKPKRRLTITEPLEAAGLFDFDLKQRADPARSKPKFKEASLETRPRSRQAALNDRLAVFLLAVIAVAPILLASNRPVFWLFWVAVVSLAFGVYLVSLARRQEILRVRLGHVPLIGALALTFFGFAVLQAVPLDQLPASVRMFDVSAFSGGRISIAPDATFLAALRWGTYLVFFFLCLQVAHNRVRAKWLAKIGFGIVIAHAVYALVALQFLGDDAYLGPENGYFGFVTGTFINRNSFATFLGMGLVTGFALLSHERRQFALTDWLSVEGLQTALQYLGLVAVGAALLATGSRMGVAATVIALVFVLLLLQRKKDFGLRNAAMLALVIAGLVVVGLIVFGKDLLDRAIFVESDARTRLAVYSQTFELIRQRPLTGFGLDTFEIAFQSVHRPPVSPDGVWDRAHSTYLALWAEMGIVIGTLPPLVVLIVFGKLLVAQRRSERDRALTCAALGVIILGGVHSLVDFSLEMQANVFLFLFILALGLSTRRNDRKRSRFE